MCIFNLGKLSSWTHCYISVNYNCMLCCIRNFRKNRILVTCDVNVLKVVHFSRGHVLVWIGTDRFCQECIVTALRSGNKECPTCRKKLVSKRSLRPDPNFDALINKIYPNRDDYNAHQERVLAARLRHSANPGAVLVQRSVAKCHKMMFNSLLLNSVITLAC